MKVSVDIALSSFVIEKILDYCTALQNFSPKPWWLHLFAGVADPTRVIAGLESFGTRDWLVLLLGSSFSNRVLLLPLTYSINVFLFCKINICSIVASDCLRLGIGRRINGIFSLHRPPHHDLWFWVAGFFHCFFGSKPT